MATYLNESWLYSLFGLRQTLLCHVILRRDVHHQLCHIHLRSQRSAAVRLYALNLRQKCSNWFALKRSPSFIPTSRLGRAASRTVLSLRLVVCFKPVSMGYRSLFPPSSIHTNMKKASQNPLSSFTAYRPLIQVLKIH